ncbi:MAG: hypothetical protein ACNS60_20210 [Candidatus Cyclobacteriaceae bacterium M2_1C_046]
MDNWDYFFWYGSVFSPIIPLFFAVIQAKKLEKYQKIIVLFIATSFAADLISLYIIKGTNYNFLHGYGLVEALILFWFYSVVLEKSKKWLFALAFAFCVFYLWDSVFLEIQQFNAIGRSVESVVFIFLSLMLLYQFYHKEDDIFLDRSPMFWFNVAILFYFSGAFFSFILSKVILSSSLSWKFHNTSNMLKNLLLAVGLWNVKSK